MAEGTYFELLRSIEDETAVRAAARAALQAVGPAFERVRTLRYLTHLRYASVEEIEHTFLAADPAREAALGAAAKTLAAAFERLGEPVAEGRRFSQPMRLDHLRRVAPVRLDIAEAHGRDDIRAVLAIRRAVFVEEQKVPLEAEYDDADLETRHALARLDGQPVATLRWRALPGSGAIKIERVAVLPFCRGRRVGERLMRWLLGRLDAEEYPLSILHAQVKAQRFYERLGYVAEGTPFMEDGILHIAMRRGAP